MSVDDGLRGELRRHLTAAQWTSVESPLTGRGYPDSEFCFPGGAAGWVECKSVRRGWAVKMRPEQVGWLDRRARLGGRAFVAVRRRVDREGTDELWLFGAGAARALADGGLRGATENQRRFALGQWSGGPAGWDWVEVEAWLCCITPGGG